MDIKFIHLDAVKKRKFTPELRTFSDLESKAKRLFNLSNHSVQLSYVDADRQRIILLETLDITIMLETLPKNRSFVELHVERMSEFELSMKHVSVFQKKLLLELKTKHAKSVLDKRSELVRDLQVIDNRLANLGIQKVYAAQIMDYLEKEMGTYFLEQMMDFGSERSDDEGDTEVRDHFDGFSVSSIKSHAETDILNSNQSINGHSGLQRDERQTQEKGVIAKLPLHLGLSEGRVFTPTTQQISPIKMATPLRQDIHFFNHEFNKDPRTDPLNDSFEGESEYEDRLENEDDLPTIDQAAEAISKPFFGAVSRIGGFFYKIGEKLSVRCQGLQNVFKKQGN